MRVCFCLFLFVWLGGWAGGWAGGRVGGWVLCLLKAQDCLGFRVACTSSTVITLNCCCSL